MEVVNKVQSKHEQAKKSLNNVGSGMNSSINFHAVRSGFDWKEGT